MKQPDSKTTVRIGLAQVAAGDDIGANVDRGLEWVDKAAAEGCALCVFPEMAFHPFFPQHRAEASYFDWAEPVPGPITEACQAKAREHGIVVIPNIFELAGPGRHYDASPIIDAGGQLLGVGEEPELTFAGGSYVVDPGGEIIAKAGTEEELLVVEIDRTLVAENRNKRPFLRDRRPDLYRVLSEG